MERQMTLKEYVGQLHEEHLARLQYKNLIHISEQYYKLLHATTVEPLSNSEKIGQAYGFTSQPVASGEGGNREDKCPHCGTVARWVDYPGNPASVLKCGKCLHEWPIPPPSNQMQEASLRQALEITLKALDESKVVSMDQRARNHAAVLMGEAVLSSSPLPRNQAEDAEILCPGCGGIDTRFTGFYGFRYVLRSCPICHAEGFVPKSHEAEILDALAKGRTK